MLLGTLGASLLGNMLTKKAMLRAGYGKRTLRTDYGKGMLRAVYGNEIDFQCCALSLNKLWNAEVFSEWI